MLTLTFTGENLAHIHAQIAAMVLVPPANVQVATWTAPAPPETAPTDEPARRRGRPPRETTPLNSDVPLSNKAVESTPTPATVVAAASATYESMKQALQAYAQKHKTNEEGMAKVSALLDTFGIKMVRDVPADKYQAVHDAAHKAIAEVGAGPVDPFAVGK